MSLSDTSMFGWMAQCPSRKEPRLWKSSTAHRWVGKSVWSNIESFERFLNSIWSHLFLRTQSSSSCWVARLVDVASIWLVLTAWWCLIPTGTQRMTSKQWLECGEMVRRRPATSTDFSLSVQCIFNNVYNLTFSVLVQQVTFEIYTELVTDLPVLTCACFLIDWNNWREDPAKAGP